jgi:WD40 repeat protein/tetratricopeptide (TPR) repeat protein
MELVHGVPITKYCDDNHLTPRERLELFVPVCQAIQHAHQKGIIHRDIKPSNVMITLYDGKPVPKVIDFGVAKATEQRLTERTLFTQYGAMVGTLEYMSPEQAEMSALGVDTRSDIYSLGVLLYELLTGSTPLTHKRIKQAAYGEVLRLIKEEEPPRPSIRLSDSGEALASISAQRHMEPAKLAKLVRGELDWIVMKTLEKDRNRRYETANGLAMDVQRYLHDETVQACPPSASYRLRKFARRNTRILATVGLLALALITGTVVSAWQAIRATEAEGLAQTRLQAETEAQNATRDQLHLTQQAEDKATNRLYHSLVAQARASRLSRRIGQRFDSLKTLEEAAKIAGDLNLPEEDFLKLRNEAIACLALPDMRIAKEWDGWPTGSLTFDFDSKLERYARVDRQGVVSIRRVADDAEICRLPGMGPGEASPWFSPDGQFLALTRPDRRFKVWKLAGPKPVAVVEELSAWGAAFSPDSMRLAVGHADGSIGLYELPSGRQLKQLDGGPRALMLAFHPEGRQLAVSCATGIQVYDVETGRILADLPQPTGAEGVAWHPNGKTLAEAGGDRIIHIWDVATRKRIARLEGHKGDGIRFAYNHAGDLLASTSWDGTMRLWDPRTGQQLFTSQAMSLRFSPDDRFLAAEAADTKLRIWEVGPSAYRTLVVDPVVGRASNYSECAISPNGRLLALTLEAGISFWDLAQRKELAFIPCGNQRAALFESSNALLTGGPDGLLRWPVQGNVAAPRLLRIGPPTRLLPFYGHGIACSRDGRIITSSLGNGGGVVLDRDHPDQPIPLTSHADVRSTAVSPDGRWAATGSHSGTKVKIWAARTGKLEMELPVETGSMVGFSPDGKWLATTGGGLSLWAIGSWNPGKQIGGEAFAFSPDSKLLAVETNHGVIRLVDPDTGREYARLEDPNQDRAYSIAFSPDGTQLVTVGNDSHSVHVWDLRTIREQLAKMGLDWDLPAYPPAEEKKDQPPLQVTVDLGPFAPPDEPRLAVAKCSLSIAFMPLNAEAYLRRGRAYYQLKQWREAADDLGVALALNPGNNDCQVWFELGYACSEAGRAKPAIAAYSRCIELNPPDSAAWNNRGLQHEALGELDKAVADFSKAIPLNDKDGLARNNRSRVYAQLGQWERVVEDCSRFLELVQGPRQVEAYYRRAGAYTQLARYREGAGDYQKLLELAPNSSLVHNDLAWLLANCPDAKLRDPVRATQLAQQAIDLAEQVGNVWNTLGVAHYRAGDHKAAVKALTKSMELRKDGDAFDFFFLAMAYWQLGQKDEAQKWHEKAVQWMQKNEEALKKDKMHDEELGRFRAEAEELLKTDKKPLLK